MDLIEYHLIRQFIRQISKGLTDIVDKINYIYTPVLFICWCSTLLLKCVIFEPIYCWCPYEFPTVWQNYVRSYCWVQPTYNLLSNGSLPSEQIKEQTKTNYYQWVPLMVIIHALLSRLPLTIWMVLSKTAGVNIRARIKEIQSDKDWMNSKEDLDQLVECFADMLESHTTDYDYWYGSSGCLGQLSRIKNWPVVKYFNSRGGTALFVYYLCTKLITVFISIFQLYLMKSFLSFGSTDSIRMSWWFGLDILRNLIHGRSWRHNCWFPRVVGCDVPLRGTGQLRIYSVKCVLSGNMINEKFYIIIWFWLILFGVVLNLVSLVVWCCKLLPLNKRVERIERLLNMYYYMVTFEEEDSSQSTSSNENRDNKMPSRSALSQFESHFLRLDGLFLLIMIELRCRTYFTLKFTGLLYQVYCQRKIHFQNQKNANS